MNCKKKKKTFHRLIRHGERMVVESTRIYGAEDKTAMTCGRLTGRSSLAQQDFLAKFGVPREKTINWTMYRASKEIQKRLQENEHTQKDQSEAVSGR